MKPKRGIAGRRFADIKRCIAGMRETQKIYTMQIKVNLTGKDVDMAKNCRDEVRGVEEVHKAGEEQVDEIKCEVRGMRG